MTRLTATDIALTLVLLAGGIWLAAAPDAVRRPGDAVVIRSVRDTTRVISLSEDRVVEVKGALGITTVSIDGGHIEFLESPCPHKICIKRGRVHTQGDYIVCVPNGVSARIDGESAFDAVVP